jgi:hypothetical protein
MEGLAQVLAIATDTIINSSTEQIFSFSLSLSLDRKVVFILKEWTPFFLFFCLFRPTKVDFSTHESLFFGHESLFSGHESPISGHESPISDTQNPHFRHTHRRENGFCHSARFAESPYIVIGEVGGDSATTRRMTS